MDPNKKLDLVLSELADVRASQRKIEFALAVVLEGEFKMALDLSALTAQVKANTDAEASAIHLIQTIAAELAANSGNQAAVDALAAQLKASADPLAAAIVANTASAPAAPAAPDAPPTAPAT
jgi:predicted RNA-binding Zn ribbon-like protein